jgi:hypothetical protein
MMPTKKYPVDNVLLDTIKNKQTLNIATIESEKNLRKIGTTTEFRSTQPLYSLAFFRGDK